MKKLSIFSKKFQTSQEGSVFILFALGLVFLVAIAGAGVDLGQQQLKTVRLQQAGDAAALAAGGISVNNLGAGGKPLTNPELMAIANRYFTLNFDLQPGEAAPAPSYTITGVAPNTVLTVDTGTELVATSFVNNFGTKSLKARGLSEVGVAPTQMSDYDVVVVADESGSQSATARCAGGTTNMTCMQVALRTMANSILPANVNNPNVRMGFVGYSYAITNKWGLSSRNADAITAIDSLRPISSNFDHKGMFAGANMIAGSTTGIAPQLLNKQYPDNGDVNTPIPRTQRNNPSDSKGMSPVKFVVFITDGKIMVEPNGNNATSKRDQYVNDEPTCGPNFEASDAEGRQCLKVFTDACTAVKNVAGPNSVHLYVIDYINRPPVGGKQEAALKQCASDKINPDPGDPDKTDYKYADNPAQLANILQNITTQIKSIRLTNVNTY